MCRIPLTELEWPLPNQRIIPAEQLVLAYQQTEAAKNAHRDAVAIVNAARRKAEKIIQEAHRFRRRTEGEMQEELETLRKTTVDQCETQWLHAHVTRLLADEALEKEVVNAVSNRIHLSLKQVLTAWFEQQPYDTTLCARLARQAEQMAAEGALTLHFHPEHQEKMRAEFGSRFTFVPEPDFPRDHAVLASFQLSVTFSLSNHFQQLLTWLHSPCTDTGEQNESIGYPGSHE
ncbi:type III secretion system stator protein SctL [Lonsdalea quercina]|uniref:type III secretion system stator protein SctL n=1 Tax=Lonsdalea quercina TaxID=71657 RepID=UPI003975F1B7